jgi:hypothetical protein
VQSCALPAGFDFLPDKGLTAITMKLPTYLVAAALLLMLSAAILPSAAGVECPVCEERGLPGRESLHLKEGSAPGNCANTQGMGFHAWAELKAEWSEVKGQDYGCHKGYCWTKCLGAGMVFGQMGEWCWNTKGASGYKAYIPCATHDDCCQYWSCAGSCSS